jgi:hypothetical protein
MYASVCPWLVKGPTLYIIWLVKGPTIHLHNMAGQRTNYLYDIYMIWLVKGWSKAGQTTLHGPDHAASSYSAAPPPAGRPTRTAPSAVLGRPGPRAWTGASAGVHWTQRVK